MKKKRKEKVVSTPIKTSKIERPAKTEIDRLMKAFNEYSLKFAYVPSYLLSEN